MEPSEERLKKLKLIFAEWLRRYQADPNQFENDFNDTPEKYGEVSTEYFIEIMNDLQISL